MWYGKKVALWSTRYGYIYRCHQRYKNTWERVTRPKSVHKLKREQMKDSKGDNTDKKANISKMSECAATHVEAIERGCQGLFLRLKLDGTVAEHIWDKSKDYRKWA